MASLSAGDFVREYFRGTKGRIYLGAIRNAKSTLPRGEIDCARTRNSVEVNKFVTDYDKPEQDCAIYYCTATIRDGHTTREAANCWQFPSLFADCDDHNHSLDRARVGELLEALKCPPTMIVNSGHGLQPHWLLAEPSEDAERIIAARKKLQAMLASDKVHDAPRYMRLPGSHNSKNGDWLPVEVAAYHPERRYTLKALEDWLDARVVVIPRKAKPKANGAALKTSSIESGTDNTRRKPLSERQPSSITEDTRVRAALQFIPSDDRETWLRVGAALHWTGWHTARGIWDDWSQTTPAAFDADDQEKTWKSFDRPYNGQPVTLATLFHLAQERGWEQKTSDRQKIPPPVTGPEDFGLPAESIAEPIKAKASEPPNQTKPIPWLDMSNWDNETRPEREWSIFNRVPLRQAGLFSGEGGAGKSIIEMMKDVAHVTAKDWLGSLPVPGAAWYLGAEDDEKEIHIRFYDIAAHYGVTFKQLIEGGLRVLCLLGRDATLCAVGKSGRVETTELYRQVYEAAGDIKPKNISIDTLSRAFAGSEIDRVQVYAFAMHMQALAMVADGSVTVLSHPSLQGISSGSGISGSTAWHGAFRFRQYLTGLKPDSGEQPDGDLRQLEFKKNQYGPIGETIVLRYQRGLFLPESGISSLDKLAREQKADEVFLALLARYEREGRNASDKPTSPTYAPAAFYKEKEATGFRKDDLAAAMRRLFAAEKIHVEQYGRPARPATRLKAGFHSRD